MLDARNETRVEVLQDACVVLQNEVVRQLEKLRQQAQRIAELQGRELTQAELLELEPPQPHQEEEPDAGGGKEEKRRRGRAAQRGHGPRSQTQLEIDEVLHELPCDERQCDLCGRELEEMGSVTEDSEVITVVERTYRLELHRRRKYRCRCNGQVKVAPGPARLIAGGRYSPEFAVQVALDKYLDHIPLERQVQRMARSGLAVSSQTLWDQIDSLARHLEPTYDAIFSKVLAEPVLHADETGGWMLAEGRSKSGRKRQRKKAQRSTAWVLSSPRYCYFALLGSKSQVDGLSLLSDFSGYLVADGYVVYENLARGDPERQGRRFQLVNCWAHTLRKFRDIEANDERCSRILSWIGQLAKIDAQVKGPFPGDEEACAQRLALRQEESRLILDEMRQWCYRQGGLRRSDFGKALAYLMSRWDGLTAFVNDGRIPLTNNLAERKLRQLVLGRKNHFGSRSKRGAKVAAILYSMVETAKLSGLDPALYLRTAALAHATAPGTATLPESLLGEN